MARQIWAFVAFNVYALFLISAFQENTAYLFDASLIKEMKLDGLDINPREWGWGGHYIWRLFAGVVVTAVVSVLSGAIAKNNGAKNAAIANIPSVIVWGVMLYLFGFTNIEVEAKTGFIIISLIAIPLTTYIAYIAGNFGEELQRQEYPVDTVLGVKGYHWIWAAFPLYWYSLGIVFVATKFIGFQLATWSNNTIFTALLSLLMLVPITAWIYPIRLVQRVMRRDLLSTSSAVIRGVANFGILAIGMIIAAGIQFGCYWLFSRIVS